MNKATISHCQILKLPIETPLPKFSSVAYWMSQTLTLCHVRFWPLNDASLIQEPMQPMFRQQTSALVTCR